jgi:DNA-binding MarR family transcriptional regulator
VGIEQIKKVKGTAQFMTITQQGEMASSLPLTALLSQALVAFTIEFDNEFENRMPHRTTNYGPTSDSHHAPWLVSLVMWSNCMQHVGAEGVTVNELQRLARTGTNLAGMQRWGYILVESASTGSRSKRPGPEAVIRSTRAGRKAQEVWRPLFGVIEQRWESRFGKDEIERLREALSALISQFDVALPDCLPILGYGLWSRERHSGDDRFLITPPDDEQLESAGSESGNASHLPLSALLSRALLAFALTFERESNVSLAISANILRVLDEQGVQVRDLPRLSGVSKEAISMAMGILQDQHLAVVEPDPNGSRFNVVRLTPKGLDAQHAYPQLLRVIDERWQERFGKDNIYTLRESLERLVGSTTTPQQSTLFKGMEPYPDGWRASVPRPETLPHFPMVLHRGGFPDGS